MNYEKFVTKNDDAKRCIFLAEQVAATRVAQHCQVFKKKRKLHTMRVCVWLCVVYHPVQVHEQKYLCFLIFVSLP